MSAFFSPVTVTIAYEVDFSSGFAVAFLGNEFARLFHSFAFIIKIFALRFNLLNWIPFSVVGVWRFVQNFRYFYPPPPHGFAARTQKNSSTVEVHILLFWFLFRSYNFPKFFKAALQNYCKFILLGKKNRAFKSEFYRLASKFFFFCFYYFLFSRRKNGF